MKWLLIVIITWGKAPVVYEYEFKNKQECVYVGSWFVDTNIGSWGVKPKVKCFEVQHVQGR